MIKTIAIFTRWLEIEKGYSVHTVSGYHHDIKEFMDHVGCDEKISTVSSSHLQSFIVSLHRNNSASTVGRKLSALRTFFRFALRNKKIQNDPLVGIAGPKIGRFIPVFLTVDETFALLEAPSERDKFMLRDQAFLELRY